MPNMLLMWLASLVVATLTACGGGSSSPEAGGAATVLPATLAIEAPASVETAASSSFRATPFPTGADLRWSWDFGDGLTSSEPAPVHSYSAGGSYEIKVVLSNGAGQRIQATHMITVSDPVKASACSGSSGWCWQMPKQALRSIDDVQFADAARGIAVGELGYVSTTQDGGRTWSVSALPPDDETLQRVRYAEDGTIYAVTKPSGRVLRSRDNAQTWQAVGTMPLGLVREFWVLGRDTLVASGMHSVFAGTIGMSVISLDRGATWRPTALIVDEVSRKGVLWANGGQQLSRDNGLNFVQTWPCCGRRVLASWLRDDARFDLLVTPDTEASETSRRVFHRSSTDGGLTWTETPIQLPPDRPQHRLYAAKLFAGGKGLGLIGKPKVDQVDQQIEWAAVTTSDGGKTWALLGEHSPPFGYDFHMLDASSFWHPTFTAPGGYGLRVVDARTDGSVAASIPEESLEPAVQLQRLPGGQLLATFGADPPSEESSGRKRWHLSLDDGATWTPLMPSDSRRIEPQAIDGIGFFDASNGLAWRHGVGLLRTTDSGLTWTASSEDLSDGTCCAGYLRIAPGGTAWLIAGSRLLRSNDRGNQWHRSTTGTARPIQVTFADAQTGWLLSDECGAEFGQPCEFPVHRTVDGGATWQATPLRLRGTAATSMDFGDRLNGIATVGEVIWRTSDGGVTWSRVEVEPLPVFVNRVRYDAQGNPWLLLAGTRSRVLRSTDQGRTWVNVALPVTDRIDRRNGLTDIRFVDSGKGWIVGDAGLVLTTDDGGTSWRVQRSGTEQDLKVVFAVDSRRAWIGGGKGVLLATSTGGE
jgi:photosystem II stability/assembly factor-like uncharacterized protein